ncbi:MAG: metalloregulator ArsR/SmtB family transcription factor [Pseudomonadota bacterium]
MSKKKDDHMSEVFRALGHPVRVQIVRILNDEGACFAGDITRRLPVVASTASQHLKILREAGLISDAADGPHRYYSVEKQALRDLQAWVRKL